MNGAFVLGLNGLVQKDKTKETSVTLYSARVSLSFYDPLTWSYKDTFIVISKFVVYVS